MSGHTATAFANAAITISLAFGTGYVVFVLVHSPWWFLAAFIAATALSQTYERKAA